MKALLTLFLLLFATIVNAQLTIKGKVFDEKNEPLPFVNIIVKKTTLGTTTDFEGKFSITLKKNNGKIEFSLLGFGSKIEKVTKKTGFLKIILKEETSQLNEVIIVSRPKKRLRKKENPAYRILKEVWKHKKKNGLNIFDSYEYKKSFSTEIGLNNLDSVSLKRVFKENYNFYKKKFPVSQDGVNSYIPIYLKEVITNVYGNNKTNTERQDIEAEKTSGVQQNGFAFQKITDAFNEIDVYKNNITIFRKSFVSPISTTGFETYDYVLQDSVIVNNKKTYSIYFFPRRDADLAFEGSVWIADKNFCITKVKMRVRKDINLNFVRKLSFEKEYLIKNDSTYLPIKDIYKADLTFSGKGDENKGLSITKINNFSDYKFNLPKTDDFYTTKIVKFRPDQFKKDDDYWKFQRKNKDIKKTSALIKSVRNNKKIKKLTGVLNTLSSGYINVTPSFQIGQYWNTITRNSVEGIKLKAGFRTFKTVDDRFRLTGFLAYGTRDKKYKFGTEAKYLLSYKPRIGVAAAYLDDTEQLGAKLLNTNGLNANIFDANALFARGDNFFLSAVKKTAIKFNIELKKNLNVGLSVAHNKIRSASPKDFTINYLNKEGNINTNVTDVSSDLYVIYTPGRFEYGYGIEQRMGKNLFPAFIINYRRGYKGILNGTHNYDKLQINYNHPILLGKLGLLITTLDGGKTFGNVPISLLNPIPANQTFWITNGTFSLINYYDFVSDTYISGHFEHHFNGLIFNKIPLIKKLNLRGLINFKTVYGTISDANRAINRSNIIYVAPTDNLYYEYGFGVENIGIGNIHPLRVDFIWRSVHQNFSYLTTPKFAVRVGIKLDL
ncbi:DUF5686 family protein [uncultured Polaribacter sp.]|uniref:DUF5686 family protein n=1 Tax=uncultured Polaribacter sp. TaxID=174711 RepID=UPI00262EE45E|nr:DUF5686 family protein [uncultured Polaribacter sp.]